MRKLRFLGKPTVWMAVLCLILVPASAAADDHLEKGFADPPRSARLRAYWWWLNGNVTKASITRDLEWMKSIGMGGGLVFDAGVRPGRPQRGRRLPAPNGANSSAIPSRKRIGSAWR